MKKNYSVPILVADDDLDDCEMIKEALEESRLINEINFVHNGEQLMEYLSDKLQRPMNDGSHLPGLILLDLNMPKMDGREVLMELKNSPHLHQIPVVILTTSEAEEDIVKSYNLGANSYITKPVEFESLVRTMRDLGRYWFEIVELPNAHRNRD